MRARVIVPVIALILAAFVALGWAVNDNVSNTTKAIVDSQMDSTLNTIKTQLDKVGGNSNSQRFSTMPASYVQSVIADFSMGSHGGVFAVDASGLVVADSTGLMQGSDVRDQAWFNGAFGTLNSNFSAEFGQTQVYARGITVDGYFVVAYEPQDTLNSYMTSPLYLIGVIGLLAIVVIGILIYLLITRLLIVPIEALYIETEHLLPGILLDIKPFKHNKQLEAVANSINELVEKIDVPLPPPEPTAAEINLADTLRSIVQPLLPEITRKRLKFSMRVEPGVPETITTERDKFVRSAASCLTEAIGSSIDGDAVEATVDVVQELHNTVTVEISVKYSGKTIRCSCESLGV